MTDKELVKFLTDFLKYAIDDTRRITGDHDGFAGVLMTYDSYEKISSDYLKYLKSE